MRYVIHTLFALAMFSLLLFGFASDLATPANAETVPQLRLRLFEEAKAQHPDVWNGCDAKCIDGWLKANPYLPGLAKQANVNPDDLVKYSVVRAYQWGLDFQKQYGRPPTANDWVEKYTGGAERVRYELAASPVIFAVDRWGTDRYFRMNKVYGGPY